MPVKANQARLVLTGKLLSMARKVVGLSQKEVADRVGCSQSNIVNIEVANYVDPDSTLLKKLGDLYDLDYAAIVACITYERYQVDFSKLPNPPGNLKEIVVERMKSKIEADLA